MVVETYHVFRVAGMISLVVIIHTDSNRGITMVIVMVTVMEMMMVVVVVIVVVEGSGGVKYARCLYFNTQRRCYLMIECVTFVLYFCE